MMRSLHQRCSFCHWHFTHRYLLTCKIQQFVGDGCFRAFDLNATDGSHDVHVYAIPTGAAAG